ncbi:MAG TPA: type I methionyl aminopeptidase [Candidatus Paceibacterota bacterium]
MVTIKTKEDIAILREGGKRHARIMDKLLQKVVVGANTKDLDDYARELIAHEGGKPAFLNFKPDGAKRPYPATICISLNDEVVHGIPNELPRILKEGDLASVDFGFVYQGLFTDMAVTVPVGKVDEEGQKLVNATREALAVGIKVAKGGKAVNDIGAAIERYVARFGYGIVEELVGHGVGYGVHEDPYVPNFDMGGKSEKLQPGMVIAIEPMLNEGDKRVTLDADGYTYRTADGLRSAHFEHTILITKSDAEVLTKI